MRWGRLVAFAGATSLLFGTALLACSPPDCEISYCDTHIDETSKAKSEWLYVCVQDQKGRWEVQSTNCTLKKARCDADRGECVK